MFGGLLGGAGSLFGDPLGISSRNSANRANDERFHAALREIDTGRDEQAQRMRGQRGDLLRALDASRGGYERAQGLLGATASASSLNASQAAQRQTGMLQAQLQRGGVGSSSAAANVGRGVASDLQRTQAGILSQTAGQQAGLAAQGGESQALLLRQMSLQRAQEAEALANWRRAKVDTLVGREDVAAPGWLPQLAGAVGQVAGAFQ